MNWAIWDRRRAKMVDLFLLIQTIFMCWFLFCPYRSISTTERMVNFDKGAETNSWHVKEKDLLN